MVALLRASVLVGLVALPVSAATEAEVERLIGALRMTELLGVMREEGLRYGADLEQGMFPGRGRDSWAGTVERIYDVERMAEEVRQDLQGELSDADMGSVISFFEGEAGARIVSLEIEARRAMLDEAVEDAATVGWMELRDEGARRWELLERFAEANDLVESNVAGALTSNYAFYAGLVEGGALGEDATDEDLLADVWSQEPSIREDTVDWVYAFTSLAYQPLSDAEFEGYVQFMETEAGQQLNSALFSAFNALFTDISRDLGRAAARHVVGQDI